MSNQYSHSSQKKLNSCHPDLQLIFKTALGYYDHSITWGFRTEDQQQDMYESGLSKLRWPLSKHNKTPSMAVDSPIYPIDWENKKRFYYFAGYILGVADQLFKQGKITHVLRWGGNWDMDEDFDDQTFMDLVHFELVIPN